jgi:DNA-directed RNA polymerase subunit M/transcription elongation factor TFIIS
MNVNELDRLIPQHETRRRIYTKFHELFTKFNLHNLTEKEIQKKAINIERGIFNYIVTKQEIKSKTWTDTFKQIYMNRAVTIMTNLNPESYLKNTNLMKRFMSGEMNEFELCFYGPEKLFPERYAEIMREYSKSTQAQDVAPSEQVIEDGMFRCGKCKTYKTSYYQMQTRSAKFVGHKSTKPKTSWLCFWENFWNPRELSMFRC